MPVKIQNMICETLESSLTQEPRRNHELYNADKMSLLYKIILSEDEQEEGDIRLDIQRLTEEAKQIIGEEEKAKRRRAQAEAEASVLNEDGSQVSPDTLTMTAGGTEGFGRRSNADGRLQNSPTKGSSFRRSLLNQQQQPVDNRFVLHLNQNGSNAQKLIDLVNSTFEIDNNDKDLKLSHEQLIMCVKILLHLVNSTQTRIT